MSPRVALALAMACAAAMPGPDIGPPSPTPFTLPRGTRRDDEDILADPSPYPRRPSLDPHHPAVARAAAKRARKASRRLQELTR